MTQAQLPPVQPYHPTTFLERGVAIPFTTPLLGGTRARPADQEGLELIVPNPSGGRGVYIMPWTSLSALCRPTMHDKVFNARIAALRGVTPGTIRRIAREIAAEGLAGEEAMEAARRSVNAEKNDLLITNYRLLMILIEQVSGVAPAARSGPDAMDPEALARLTVARVAPHLSRSTEWTASALESLAEVLTSVGVGVAQQGAAAARAVEGRVPRLIEHLRRTRDDIDQWGRRRREEDQANYARMICAVADLTLSLSEALLTQAHALTDDMISLLRAWAADPKAVVRMASRPEWLLDGWEPICLIWDHARDDTSRLAALVEIAGHVPILPREAGEWCERVSEADESFRRRRLIRLNEDWRTGATVFDLIARNEHFRALGF